MAQQVIIAGSGWTNLVQATGSGELLVTGSVRDIGGTGSLIDKRLITSQGILTEILGEMKIMNEQMRLITNETIREVEI